jgi:hypothetical protein
MNLLKSLFLRLTISQKNGYISQKFRSLICAQAIDNTKSCVINLITSINLVILLLT